MKKDEREALKENELFEKSMPILKWLEKNAKVIGAVAFLFLLVIVVFTLLSLKNNKEDLAKQRIFQEAKLKRSSTERAKALEDILDNLKGSNHEVEALLSIADAHVKKENVNDAKKVYEKIIAEHSNSSYAPFATLRLAGIYSSYKFDGKIDYQKALSLYKSVQGTPELNLEEVSKLIKECEEAISEKSTTANIKKDGDKVSE